MSRRRGVVDPSEPPIVISESEGVRYLHFGTPWIQGAMRLRSPDRIELDYVRHMMAWLLFLDPPARALQLGLGAGALARFFLRFLPQTELTVVERSASVIEAGTRWFRLPGPRSGWQVVQADAQVFLRQIGPQDRYGVLQVDLYDEHARGPVLDSIDFYADCYRALADPGVLVLNLFGAHEPREARSQGARASLLRIGEAFSGRVIALPAVDAGNVVALAFKGPVLEVSRQRLFERAREISQRWGLPARGWAQALGPACDRGILRR